MPRPRQGKQVKERYSIRLEPKMHKELVNIYGSLTNAIHYLIPTYIYDKVAGKRSKLMPKRVKKIETSCPWDLKIIRQKGGFIKIEEHHRGSNDIEKPYIIIPADELPQVIDALFKFSRS